MKIKLDGIYSSNLPSGYEELPKDPKNCWIMIHADIGPDDSSGCFDCFTFYVCTPKFLKESLGEYFYQIGRALIIVPEFNWMLVEKIIESICAKVKGNNWEEIADELCKYGEYEFDYEA
jgi:hypothetical protein